MYSKKDVQPLHQPWPAPTKSMSTPPHRRTTRTLHATTSAPASGLGRQLAGTINDEAVWMPDSLPWDPATAEAAAHRLSSAVCASATVAVAAEVERARQVDLLRVRLRARCQSASLPAPPMNAIERWLLLAKWHEGSSSSSTSASSMEPLLPATTGSVMVASPADSGLRADLERAGATVHVAAQLVEDLRADAAAASGVVSRVATEAACGGGQRLPAVRLTPLGHGLSQLRLVWQPGARECGPSNSDSDGSGDDKDNSADDDGDAESGDDAPGSVSRLAGAGSSSNAQRADVAKRQPSDDNDALCLPIQVSDPCLAKLRDLFARHAHLPAEEFLPRAYACLLRYRAVGGMGFQAALGGAAFEGLQARLACNFEAFASPLNCFYGAYCSAFPDVDVPFGSRGSFANFKPRSGSYQVSKPPVALHSSPCHGNQFSPSALICRDAACAGSTASTAATASTALSGTRACDALSVRWPLSNATCMLVAAQVNPPFVPAIIDGAAGHMIQLLTDAQLAGRPLAFVVVLPGWTDCAGYRALLEAGPLLRHTLLVAAADHGFVDGAQHVRHRSHRESPYDTMVFVLQTDTAAKLWPADSAAVKAIERAMAACTPTAEALAAVDSRERVHRDGAVRKHRRRKKRAGAKTRAAAAARAAR